MTLLLVQSGVFPSGGWTPADMSNLFIWLDATVGVTFGSPPIMASWDDQSGNARTVTAGADSGTRTQNSLNVIDSATGIGETGNITLTPEFWVFAVCAFDDGADASLQVLGGNYVGPNYPRWGKSAADKYFIEGNLATQSSATTVDSAWHTLFWRSHSSAAIYIDGALDASGTNVGTTGISAAPLYIGDDGTGNLFDGGLAELFIGTGDQSAQVANAQAYLQARWGTP